MEKQVSLWSCSGCFIGTGTVTSRSLTLTSVLMDNGGHTFHVQDVDSTVILPREQRPQNADDLSYALWRESLAWGGQRKPDATMSYHGVVIDAYKLTSREVEAVNPNNMPWKHAWRYRLASEGRHIETLYHLKEVEPFEHLDVLVAVMKRKFMVKED